MWLRPVWSLILGFGTVVAVVAGVGEPAAGSPRHDQIAVRLRGTTGTERAALSINGEVVATWHDVPAVDTTFVHDVAAPIDVEELKVHFLNDGRQHGVDKNLVIDRITVGGVAYESEDPRNDTLGRWTTSNACGPGRKRTEVLHCNGWISYAGPVGLRLGATEPDPGTDPGSGPGTDPATDPGPESGGSSIVVHARGAQGSEAMELRINDRAVAQWDGVGTDLRPYTHAVQDSTTIERLTVHFTNDGGWPVADKNLHVDKVVVDGTAYESEAPTTRSNGSWSRANGCGPGHKRSEWLHCGAAWFDYAAAAGTGLVGQAADPPSDPPAEPPRPPVDPPHDPPTEPPLPPVDPPEPPAGPPSDPSARISVFARGTTGTERISLSVNGVTVESWDPLTTELTAYHHHVTEPVTIEDLRVHFENDGRHRGVDKNVVIDRVEVGAATLQSEAVENRSLGRWTRSNACGEGRKRTEVLHCNGWIAYAAAEGLVLAPATTDDPVSPPPDTDPHHLLVMTKASDFVHPSIPDGIEMLEELARDHDFELTVTDDSSIFGRPAAVADLDAVVFLNTDGVVFETEAEKQAFRAFIESGRGFVGIHGAAATHWKADRWDWYRDLVGQRFVDHPPGRQPATVVVVDPGHRSTGHLPERWRLTDEWYNFEGQPVGVDVLLTVDETSYRGGTMGDPHPVAWSHTVGASRAWYTNLGHEPALYDDPLFVQHVLGGIAWVLDGEPGP